MSLLLDLAAARVLASLVEKSLTTPQYYPMTLNAVMLAANQKTSRYPVMNLSEGEAGAALNTLEELKFTKRDEYSGRAVKWRHQFQHQLLLKPDAMAVLTMLILRGPQTLMELRANASPLSGPADADGVQRVLNDLADRAQPLATVLPRVAGQSTVRWAHLLCGEPQSSDVDTAVSAPAHSSPGAAGARLLERIEALEARVAELERQLS